MSRPGYWDTQPLSDEELHELECELAYEADLEQFRIEDAMATHDDDPPWTDADEAGLEQYEEQRRIRIAEANEY